MNELIEYFQLLLEYADANIGKLNPESQAALAQMIQQFGQLIEELGRQTTGTPIPDLPTADYPSSNVNGYKYDPESGDMLVQFHGPYPNAAGPIYKYSGVQPFVFDIIRRGAVGPKTSGKNRYHQWFKGVTPSHGASVNALLKAGGYNYQRLS